MCMKEWRNLISFACLVVRICVHCFLRGPVGGGSFQAGSDQCTLSLCLKTWEGFFVLPMWVLNIKLGLVTQWGAWHPWLHHTHAESRHWINLYSSQNSCDPVATRGLSESRKVCWCSLQLACSWHVNLLPTLSTRFDIFIITYRVTNCLPKLIDMLLFSTEKTEFPFLVFPYFRVMPIPEHLEPHSHSTEGCKCRYPCRGQSRMFHPNAVAGALLLESVVLLGCTPNFDSHPTHLE